MPIKNLDSIATRKTEHFEICCDPLANIEPGNNFFQYLHFIHQALPELHFDEIQSSFSFLGYSITAPFFISCMTGGSNKTALINREFACAASEAGIPMGLGSIRALLKHPEVFDHFYIRPFTPNIPIFANIGAVQTKEYAPKEILEWCKRLEVDALVIHLNAGQELFQPNGDRDFKGLISSIETVCHQSTIPVIVKETGFGITPALALELIGRKVSYIDCAGSGGTNWILVESLRNESGLHLAAAEFSDWGLPTALLLDCYRTYPELNGKIIASGGIRTGLDLAKCLALGALMGGIALPFIRSFHQEGREGVLKTIHHFKQSLKRVMALTGCTQTSDLKTIGLWRDPYFNQQALQLQQAMEKR